MFLIVIDSIYSLYVGKFVVVNDKLGIKNRYDVF